MGIAETINGKLNTIPEEGDPGSVWADNTTTILQRCLRQGKGVYNVLWYDADNTGTSDTGNILEEVIASADDDGGIIYFPPGTYRVGDQVDGRILTFPSNVTAWFADGASLYKLTTVTVVINGSLIAPRSQIFQNFNAGDITYGSKVSPVLQEWEGNTAEDSFTVKTKVLRQSSDVQTVTADTSSVTIDYDDGFNVRLLLQTNVTSVTLSNPRDGERMVIRVNNTGAYDITGWPGAIKWRGGTPSITPGTTVDVITLMYFEDDSDYLGNHGNEYT